MLFKGGMKILVSGCLPAPFVSHIVFTGLILGPAVETTSPDPSSLPREGKYLPLWEKESAKGKD